jgi:hypothetical protein
VFAIVGRSTAKDALGRIHDGHSSPKISEKPDPKRTSGARVAFSTSSQPIFAAEPQAVPA